MMASKIISQSLQDGQFKLVEQYSKPNGNVSKTGTQVNFVEKNKAKNQRKESIDEQVQLLHDTNQQQLKSNIAAQLLAKKKA